MNWIRLVAMSALVVACEAALAQTSDIENLPPARAITLTDIRGGHYRRSTYGDRSQFVVYDTGIGTDTGGGFAGPVNTPAVMDDVVFGGEGAVGDILINSIGFGVWVPAAGFTDQLYMKVSFCDTYDTTLQTVVTPVSDPTAAAGVPVVWDLDIGAGWSAAAGAGMYFADPVTFGETLTLSDAFIGLDRLVGVRMELFSDPGLTINAANHACIRRANNTGNVVGSTNVQGYYAGIPGNSAINTVSGGTLSGGGSRGTYLALARSCDGVGISVQPVDQPFVIGQTVVLSLVTSLAVGCETAPTYGWQWYDGNNWVNLEDGPTFRDTHTPSLWVLNPTRELAMNPFRCSVVSNCGCNIGEVLYSNEVWLHERCISDTDNNGVVDGDDVIMFFEHWDRGC